MSPPRPRPPRWARRLLEAVLPDGPGGRSVLADLEEELAEVAARRGPGAARRWFAWEALKLAAHYGLDAAGRLRPTWRSGGEGTVDRVRRNLRIAARRLRRRPGFAALAVATIALGIGANVAIFSVVDGVLLSPLPYRDAGELVAIWERHATDDAGRNPVNPGNFAAWRDRTSSFEAMSAVSLGIAVTLDLEGRPEELWGQYAHPDFFRVLGLEAAVGRTFAPDAAGPGADATEVVLSHRYWRGHRGGDPSVVGRTVRLNGGPAVVVGVLPPEYVAFGEGTDVWASVPLDRGDQTNTGRWIMVLGRLAGGVGFEAAAAELDAVSAGLREEFPDFNAGWTAQPLPLFEEIVGEVRRVLWVLMGAVGLLLLIACANVANLLLVRATERQQEAAVRTSLGASRSSLVAQHLTESLLLAGLGATSGTVLGWLGTRALASRLPDAWAVPRIGSVTVDASVLGVTVGATVLTGLLFGLLPALQAARTGPATVLNAEERGPSRRSGRIRDALVVVEVAVSVVLLAGAALFARSLSTLMAVEPGIETAHVLVGRVNLVGDRYGEGARSAFFDALMGRLDRHPEVQAAGGIGFLPMDGAGAATAFWRTDRPAPPAEERPSTWVINVTGRYFDAMGVGLVRGRLLDERDAAEAPRAVVVSRTLVDRVYGDEDPLGKSLRIEWREGPPWEIVDVVEDVRMEGLDQGLQPAVYMRYAQSPTFRSQQIVVRAAGDAARVAPVLREQVRQMDPSLAVGDVREMDDIVATSTLRRRLTTFLMVALAAMATVLAGVGLYGLLAYVVSRRVREIGVRVAMGARPGDVVRLVVRRGAGLAVTGVVAGVALTLAGGQVVTSLLYGVAPTDPWALGGATAFLLGVALAACAVPAWRGARLAPAEALRTD